MKKVVLLAPYFLPRRRVGAWRPFKFAIHLKKFGWEPHVITIHETKGRLTEKEKSLLSNIPIHKIKSPFDLTHHLNNGLAYNGFNDTAARSKSMSPTKNVLNWVDKQFPIDSWLPLFVFRRNQVENIVRNISPHILWSTGDPWSSHWMGKKISDKFNIPWVVDFRDPWTLGNINLRNRSTLSNLIDKREEAKILDKATYITFNARQTELLYKDHYENIASKTSTVYNCYDSSLFDELDGKSDIFQEDHLNLLFFGTFRPLSPAAPFIHLLDFMYKQSPSAAEKVKMYCFGPLSSTEKSLAQKKGVYKNFISLDKIPLEKALPLLNGADILWLSTHFKRKNIIPAKLWDYLAARRPILSVAPNPEIQEIIHQTGTGMQVNMDDKDKLIDIFIRCLESKAQNKSIALSTEFKPEHIKKYDAPAITQEMAAVFDMVS